MTPTLHDLYLHIPAHAPNRDIAVHYSGEEWNISAVNRSTNVMLGESCGYVEVVADTLEAAIELAMQKLDDLRDDPDSFN